MFELAQKSLGYMYPPNCHSVDLWTLDILLYDVVWTCGLKTFTYMK